MRNSQSGNQGKSVTTDHFRVYQMEILSQHHALLFISSVPSVKELHSDKQTWLMSGCDTAELLSVYRRVSAVVSWLYLYYMGYRVLRVCTFQILFVSRCEESEDDRSSRSSSSVYSRHFPPGWCLLDHLEERHRSSVSCQQCQDPLLISEILLQDTLANCQSTI